MQMLYVCTRDLAQALVAYTHDFHYLDLPNGMAIVTVEFSEATHEMTFSSQPNVTACPHPLSGQTFGQYTAILPLLSQFGITATDTHYTAREKLSQVIPHFKVI